MEAIKNLEKNNCVLATIQNNDASITFNEVREDEHTINRVAKYLEKQNELKTNQLASVINYANNETTCKSKLLLSYFDEKNITDCGICSYCLSKEKNNPKIVLEEIVSCLIKRPQTSRELEQELHFSTNEILLGIQLLLENNKIAINNHNQYYLL